MKPLFSVIIPTLNEAKFLPKLLASLVSQTEKNFEVILVDGSSRDKTVILAKKYPGIKIIVSAKASLPLQRNLGAKEATGEWLLFLDADDVLLPHAIAQSRSYIETYPKVKFFTTWFTPDGDTFADVVWILLAILFVESAKNMKRQVAPGPFIAVRKDVFDESGGFEESRAYGEDQEYSMRLFEKGIHLEILRESLYEYSLRRMRKDGVLKIVQVYTIGSIITFLTKRAPRQLAGYVMGGHLYNKKSDKSKLQKIIQDLFT